MSPRPRIGLQLLTWPGRRLELPAHRHPFQVSNHFAETADAARSTMAGLFFRSPGVGPGVSNSVKKPFKFDLWQSNGLSKNQIRSGGDRFATGFDLGKDFLTFGGGEERGLGK